MAVRKYSTVRMDSMIGTQSEHEARNVTKPNE